MDSYSDSEGEQYDFQSDEDQHMESSDDDYGFDTGAEAFAAQRKVSCTQTGPAPAILVLSTLAINQVSSAFRLHMLS